MELLVLALVGLIVIGPDKLPGLARDAARMMRTLREMATGARTQLRDELGPEFADLDLRSLIRALPSSGRSSATRTCPSSTREPRCATPCRTSRRPQRRRRHHPASGRSGGARKRPSTRTRPSGDLASFATQSSTWDAPQPSQVERFG